MHKMDINDFPSLDGVSLISTKTLKLILDVYNSELEKEMYQFEDSVIKRANLVKEGKATAYSDEEFLKLLKEEGL